MSHATINYTEERIDAFPTRIFRRQFDGLLPFNRRMAELILEKEQQGGEGIARSNVGGWHSENDLIRWDYPEVAVLLGLFESALLDAVAAETGRDPKGYELSVSLESWANVARTGDYMKPHVHPMTNFALVYYVDAGDYIPTSSADYAGCIEFLDPRTRPNMVTSPGIDPRDCLVSRPATGTLLVFPAWMYHYVHPYKGTKPRISVAANALVQRLTPKTEGDPVEGRPAARIIEAD